MKPKALTLLILTAIVMASVLLPLTNACGTPPPAEVIVVTANPPPAPAIPSAEDLQQAENSSRETKNKVMYYKRLKDMKARTQAKRIRDLEDK